MKLKKILSKIKKRISELDRKNPMTLNDYEESYILEGFINSYNNHIKMYGNINKDLELKINSQNGFKFDEWIEYKLKEDND